MIQDGCGSEPRPAGHFRYWTRAINRGARVHDGRQLGIPTSGEDRMEVSLQQAESVASQRRSSIADLRWYFAFFVVSGFCGLVYEIVWLRLAMASFGVTTALASIVISMFMAGLGLGSWGAGALTRRVLATNVPLILRLYSVAELCVGISSLAVPLELKVGRQLLLHMGSYGAWQSWRYYLLAGIWIAVTLLPWCTCMGATFPLLMAAIRQTARSASERSFSYLYVRMYWAPFSVPSRQLLF